jgi:putative ATP-dependent endonuclease of OLD family
MRFSSLSMRNFRSLAHADLTLSSFVCTVGHNNAGKSSMLMALSLFRSGSRLNQTDYYDPDQDVVFTVTIEGIDDNALERIGVHADRISDIVVDGTLTLVRRYDTNGSSSLNCLRPVPTDERFHEEHVTAILKGKKGKELQEVVKYSFPELKDEVERTKPTTQKSCKELIDGFIESLPANHLSLRESALPSGIPNSIDNLLPEVVYIPAVKDATDEVKTKEASSFGKIIKVLLDLVEGVEQLQNIADSFSDLHRLLNKITDDDGNVTDDRIEEVRRIEERVQGFIREQFRNVNVEIQIPPPDLKTIFSGARIFLDDGVRGEVDSKGDGLKRAVTFALLRTFVEMRREQNALQQEEVPHNQPRYLFLFEEPELYLHPNAQRILYDALREISTEHQVCVSTHSPFFFSAADSGTYIRLRKDAHGSNGQPPSSEALHINLVDSLSVKDSFQIICYENNNAAFFCDRVVLVEGDCDIIYLKHLARTLKPEWDFDRRNISIVKVGGKGSFHRYREFFRSFDVEVRIVADLDAVTDQFDKLGVSNTDTLEVRNKLIQSIDKLVEESEPHELSRSQLKEITHKRTFRERYDRCKAIAAAIADGATPSVDEVKEFSELFAQEADYLRRKVLAEHESLVEAKEHLLTLLRDEGIVVLSKGAIEEYYPDGVVGDDKPSRALSACQLFTTTEHVRSLCGEISCGDGSRRSELDLVFECLFG